jgi:hypothetical protein
VKAGESSSRFSVVRTLDEALAALGVRSPHFELLGQPQVLKPALKFRLLSIRALQKNTDMEVMMT